MINLSSSKTIMIPNDTIRNIHPSYLAAFVLAFFVIEATAIEEWRSNIRKLKEDLLENYDKLARPFKNASIPVLVEIQLTPLSLMELNEKEEKLVLNAWVLLKWKDEHLQWKMDEYDGIKRIHCADNEIWHPNIIVLNSAPVTNREPWHRSLMMVYHTGYVYRALSSTLSTHCPMTILTTEEERLCKVSLTSWMSYKEEVELKLYWEDIITDYLQNNNSEWEIKDIRAVIEQKRFQLLYDVATFIIKLHRRQEFDNDITIGPRMISILFTLSMFWIPVNSKEKLKLGCLALLIISVLMIYLSSTIMSPSLLSTKVSLLRVTLFTATSALLMEVIVLKLSRLNDIIRPPPILVSVLTGINGKIFSVCSQPQENDDDGRITRFSEFDQQLNSKQRAVENEWLLITTLLDRCFFFIYTIVYVLISFV